MTKSKKVLISFIVIVVLGVSLYIAGSALHPLTVPLFFLYVGASAAAPSWIWWPSTKKRST